jgi:hypothetical protein
MLLFGYVIASFATDGFGIAHAFSRNIRTLRCRSKSSISQPSLLTYEYPSHDVRSFSLHRASSTRIRMVRNVDLPEAIVFYGLESIFEPPREDITDADVSRDVNTLKLRPGISRILEECREVGTAALILSEHDLNEVELRQHFATAWDDSYSDSKTRLQTFMNENEPVLSFRCINEKFSNPVSEHTDEALSDPEFIFYNLLLIGRSPSPAFLLDSLQSIQIDPRGFGGSSGFARGQWVEPRRSPMTARTVVFISGDWQYADDNILNNIPWLTIRNESDQISAVRDRCAAVRAAGCRIIYM